MDFVEAVERLKRSVTDEEIAVATGVSTNTIRRSRADPSTRNYRPPPPNWSPALIALAERRAADLLQLAKVLAKHTPGDR